MDLGLAGARVLVFGSSSGLGRAVAATLAADLAHPGNPRAAAARLHIHPNTFRYRLRRLADVATIDLTDPVVRLAVQLELEAAARR